MSVGGPQAGRGRLVIALSAAAIVVVVVAAWVLQAGAGGGAESPAGDSASPYSISVWQGGEVLKRYDLAALHALSQASLVIDGKEQEGPLLRTVLEDAGADPSAAVDVVGAGIRDEGRLTLTAEEVDRDVQLDFSDRGTVKACSAWLDRGEWVRDVVAIDAR
jgi:hypothetical protein